MFPAETKGVYISRFARCVLMLLKLDGDLGIFDAPERTDVCVC